MTLIVLIGHGGLPEGMRDAAELILGPQPRLHAVSLTAGQSPEDLRQRLKDVVSGGSALVLADIHGGTPWNVASVVAHGNPVIDVVTGFNLPMVLAVLTGQGESVAELAVVAAEARMAG